MLLTHGMGTHHNDNDELTFTTLAAATARLLEKSHVREHDAEHDDARREKYPTENQKSPKLIGFAAAYFVRRSGRQS